MTDDEKATLKALKDKLRQREDRPGWKASAEKIKAEIARLEALNA
jgi:hypothetical protein